MVKKILLGIIVIFLGGFYLISNKISFYKYFYPDKVWIHRVNSIEKLEEVKREFAGIEVDVVWKENNFDINHPPAESIELYLEEYLQKIDKQNDKIIWLDFKNLDQGNAPQALRKLDSVVEYSYVLKTNVIVESINPEHLKYFNRNGYKTSFYLPGNLRKLTRDSLEVVFRRIKHNMDINFTHFLSFPIEDYHIVKNYFPEKNMLVWELSLPKGINRRIRLYKVLNDNKVAGVLMPYQANTGNR